MKLDASSKRRITQVVLATFYNKNQHTMMRAYTACYNTLGDVSRETSKFIGKLRLNVVRKMFILNGDVDASLLNLVFKYYTRIGMPDGVSRIDDIATAVRTDPETVLRRTMLISCIVLHSPTSAWHAFPSEVLREILLMSLGHTSDSIHVPNDRFVAQKAKYKL